MTWIGHSLRRLEDERLLRGAGQYVADIDRPDQVHASFVRSPLAHADILGLETSTARNLTGVAGVLTHRDVPDGPIPPFLWDSPPPKIMEVVGPQLRPCHPPLLAADRVRFVGQAVAMVLARSRYEAEDAAELVEVDYDPLPVAATTRAALEPGAPRIHEGWEDNVAAQFVLRKGDPQAAFTKADLVVRELFTSQRQAGLPLETRGAVAEYNGYLLTVWSSTQNAHPLRRALGVVCDLPLDRVRVVAPDVGGGFGTKGVLYPEDLLVALAAIQLGRPVKWVEDRVEHMQSAIHAREQEHEIELAVSRDGAILGLRDRFVVDCGAFNPLGIVIPYNTAAHLMGPYRVPAMEVEATCVLTNKVPTAPYRGAGRPEAVFAVERAIDRAARVLELDRVDVRLRSLIRPDEMPYATGILYRDGHPLVMDSGNYPEALRRAADLIGDHDGSGEEDTGSEHEQRSVGVGLACYVEGTGIGPFEGAALHVDETGTVSIHTGACSQGQGHATIFAQVCADHLGVGVQDVIVVGGDTAKIERGWGTVASRSAVVAGNAVAEAAERIREQALHRAAEMLEVSEFDLTMENGNIFVVGSPDKEVTLAEVAREAESSGSALAATSYHEPDTVTWANGVHAAVVSVDRETGEVKILRYVVVHDCGTVINPAIVEGQIHGGVAQGIAGALYEEVLYDDEGQCLNATLMDYLTPTSGEVPRLQLEHMETPSPLNPLGVKGVGEGGAIPGPAVLANAVEDALLDFGAIVRRTPLSPPYVRSLLGRLADL